MQTVALSDIQIPENRIRRHFDDNKLLELARSILEVGLLHPIVLRHNDKLQVELVAGERRLRAIRRLHGEGKVFTCNGEEVAKGEAPYTMVAELDPLELKEAELQENVCRADISWQERADALGELHKLRRTQDPSWSMRKTTEEATGNQQAYNSVRQLVTLSSHLSDDEIAAAETPSKAMRALRRKAAATLEASYANYLSKTGAVDESLHFQCRDGVELLESLAGTIDCILTDPPYGINADAFHNYTSELHHGYDDSTKGFQELIERFAPAAYTAAAERAHLYMFCDHRWWPFLVETFTSAKWRVWPWPLIWVKEGEHGLAPDADHAPARCYESILFANKGNRPTRQLQRDVIQTATAKEKIHAAQKPLPLLTNLLNRSVSVGAKVCDPFAGSGSTILAARSLGCEVFAAEIVQDIYNAALLRVSTETEDGDEE